MSNVWRDQFPDDDADAPDGSLMVDLARGDRREKVGGVDVMYGPGGEVEVDLEPGAFAPAGVAADHWNSNLAELIDPMFLGRMGDDILELVEADKQTRQEWTERFARGLEILGVRDMPKGAGAFNGAATVTHPLLMEAVVQFQARAIEEVFPSAGPVKAVVLGDKTEERMAQAERVADYMNYQLTREDKSYFWNVDQMLFMLPISGSAFKKCYRDRLHARYQARYVPAEDFIVPYSATSLEDAPRYTHVIRMSPNDVKKMQARRAWRAADLGEPASPSRSETRELIDEADGRQPSGHESDNQHEIYEVHIDWNLVGFEDPDEIALPYIVTIDRETRQVLAIGRNWKQNDPLQKKRIWFVHYKYLPGVGFYGFGLIHAIGSLAEAATGALRALLDAAAFSTLQGGFKSKDARLPAGAMHLEPGVWKDLDLTAEELNKAFYTPPFKEPSPAVYQLLALLVQSGQRFASTTEAMVGDADNKAPVGTTVALIEQGSKVFSGIHKRTHIAAGEEFGIQFEINAEHVPLDGYPYDVPGASREIFADDFDGNVEVAPVSDPNIFSSTQRIMIAQSTLQLAMGAPQLYNLVEVHRRMLSALRVPQPDALLIDPENMPPMDPVSENMALLVMRPIRAFMDQDHEAHIAVHLSFFQHPEFGGNPAAQQAIGAAMMAHLGEHMAWLYKMRMGQLGVPTSPVDLQAEPGQPVALADPAGQNLIAALAAQQSAAFMQMRGIPPMGGPGQGDDTEAKIQREDKLAEAKVGREDKAHKRKMERDDEAFEKEQARQDRAAEASLENEAAAALLQPRGEPSAGAPAV